MTLINAVPIQVGGYILSRDRLGGLDAWRIVLPLLGIVYHVVDASIINGHVLNLACLPIIIHAFRMEGFFVIAGYLASRNIRNPGYLGQRARVLLLPLISLSLLIGLIAPQRGIVLVYGATQHLWFLVTMMGVVFFCAALVHLRILERLASRDPFVLAGIVLVASGAGRIACTFLQDYLPESSDATFSGLILSVAFAPYFMFGLLAARNPRFAALTTSRLLWCLSVIALIIWLIIVLQMPAPTRIAGRISFAQEILLSVTATLCCCAILGSILTSRWHPGRAARFLASASYSIYLFHFPVLKGLSRLFIVDDVLTIILAVGATTTVCLALHIVLTRSRVLMTLFNGAKLSGFGAGPRPPAAGSDKPAERPSNQIQFTGADSAPRNADRIKPHARPL